MKYSDLSHVWKEIYKAEWESVCRGSKAIAAMITDENLAISRVLRMIREGMVQAIDGTDTSVRADSVCVHGDGEKALLFARKIRDALMMERIPVKAPSSAGNT